MKLDDFRPILFGEELTDSHVLTADIARTRLSAARLEDLSRRFRETPIDDILAVLAEVGELLADPTELYRREAMEALPSLLNYSPEMVAAGLDMLPQMLARESLKLRLAPLGDYHCLDHFVREKWRRWNRAIPVGSVCHVAAGNVFLGSVDSLVHGIVTKNVNLLKVSGQDLLFPTLFFRALQEVDADRRLFPYVGMTYWHHTDFDVDSFIKTHVDAILLFGGEQAVASYKQGLAANTEVHAFGPKISFGLVRRGLTDGELRSAARGFARDIVFWEQRACTSCQNIFIEEDGRTEAFAGAVFAALEEMGREYPQGNVELDAAVEIRKERELARWRAFSGSGLLLEGRTSQHTVILQDSCDIVDSPLNRTVFINRVPDYHQILGGSIGLLKYYMSTVSIAAGSDTQQVVEDFTALGVMRFCEPGSMSTAHDPAAPHDGMAVPRLLVRFIHKEDLPPSRFGIEFLESGRKQRILLARLNDLLRSALRSPYYRERLSGVRLPLRSLDDYRAVPVLEKADLAEHAPDRTWEMLTADPRGCYIFSAGGTTGKMKYVCYSNEEFADSKKQFGLGFAEAGIVAGDVVANFMRAGALWTAFLATNAGLEETGCRILSLTANQPEADTIKYLLTFKPNTIMSVTSNLVLLAQAAEAEGHDVTIEKIYYTGEHMPPTVADYLRRVFRTTVIRSLGYAAVETGPVGFQCPSCEGTEHHVLEDWCYVEATEDGDALVTTLKRHLHPMIRYRVGDRIEWVSDPCPCGRTTPRFRLLSRSDDIVRLNFSQLHLSQVFEAVADVPELSSTFQVLVDAEGAYRVLTFRVEVKHESTDRSDPHLRERLVEALKRRSPSLGQHFDLNLIKELRVELEPPNGIERIARTGKVRRIIDRRL